jgi:hypothetical protein
MRHDSDSTPVTPKHLPEQTRSPNNQNGCRRLLRTSLAFSSAIESNANTLLPQIKTCLAAIGSALMAIVNGIGAILMGIINGIVMFFNAIISCCESHPLRPIG